MQYQGSIDNILNDQCRNLSMSTYVSGGFRPLYFKRPIVSKIQDIPVQLANQQIEISKVNQLQISQPQNTEQEQELSQKIQNIKTVEIQTDFRESEAQTDPYTPNYVIKEGETPEVLNLSHFQYGKGLPASIDELEQIEATREKTWLENALPPISDEHSFNLRRKLMEEQEHREWNKKENEIKKFQNEKLYLLQSSLIEREKDTEEKNAQRIEEIKIKKTEQKNRLIAKIQRRKLKVLRKLVKRRKEIDQDKRKRDIIEEYANFGSKVYAGITREGLSLDKIANKYEVQPVSLTTYQGITQLEQSIKPVYFESKINIQKIQDGILKKYTRLEMQHKNELKKAREEIEGKYKKQKDEQHDEFRKYSLSKMRERPATPFYQYHNDIDNIIDIKEKAKVQANVLKRYQSVLLLQRLIRGRFMQNLMYEGKEKRLALIEELLTVAKIPDLPENEIDEILLQAHEEKVKNALVEGMQGEVISKTLDILSKELLRFQQENHISKLVQKAETERRMREIEESGRRQAEISLQERQDVLYDQIMRVHQGTVDNYLSWIMSNTIEKASVRQAIIMSKLRKDKMVQPIESYERRLNNHETIIKDLVSSFLLPNIQRKKIEKQIQLEELRYAEAAKKSLQNSLSNFNKEL